MKQRKIINNGSRKPEEKEQNSSGKKEVADIREAALRILDYSDNTSKDLTEKLLKKGYPPEGIRLVVKQLSEADLLNDMRYAESYIREKTEAGKGPLWIRKKLMEKGIDRGLIDQILPGLSERGTERKLCLSRALEICGLKYDFAVDGHGNLFPVDGSPYEYNRVKVFDRAVKNGGNRVKDYRDREKAKARMARKLSSAGFSSDAVMFAVRKIESL